VQHAPCHRSRSWSSRHIISYGVTVTVTVFDVDGLKAGLFGINLAVSWWVPTLSWLVSMNATGPNIGCGAPNGWFPSMNWTIPVAPIGWTIATIATNRP
jgi:hypothetical protein